MVAPPAVTEPSVVESGAGAGTGVGLGLALGASSSAARAEIENTPASSAASSGENLAIERTSYFNEYVTSIVRRCSANLGPNFCSGRKPCSIQRIFGLPFCHLSQSRR